eukprot:286944-Chlamydomonas_euryale.AAC.9
MGEGRGQHATDTSVVLRLMCRRYGSDRVRKSQCNSNSGSDRGRGRARQASSELTESGRLALPAGERTTANPPHARHANAAAMRFTHRLSWPCRPELPGPSYHAYLLPSSPPSSRLIHPH